MNGLKRMKKKMILKRKKSDEQNNSDVSDIEIST